MKKPKKVLCIMDLASVGRCSLSVAIPVLSASGNQACPLPASMLASHTGGFSDVPTVNMADFCQTALHHFKKENVGFDAVYIGYLADQKQFDLAHDILEQYPSAYLLVDPAMADNGRLYSSLPQNTPHQMLVLCQKAMLITPNQTEADMLLQEMGCQNIGALGWDKKALLLAEENKSVLITGVNCGDGQLAIYGYDNVNKQGFCHKVPFVGQSFPGTGDLFASAVLGQYLNEITLQNAVVRASEFLNAAISASYAAKAEPREGILFEPFLKILMRS